MNRTSRRFSIACLVVSLSACVAQEDSSGSLDSTPLHDEISADAPNPSPGGSTTSADLLNDGLIAPTAPELSISARPGALQFRWIDRDNTTDTETQTKLFEYNSRTMLESEVDASIVSGDNTYNLNVAPHQLAWDNLSYRVEICTNSNCLSSLRMPVSPLLSDALSVIQPSDADLFPGYGSHLAISRNGKIAVAANPQGINATVHFRHNNNWVLASSLTPAQRDQNATAHMRVSMSSSGDTIAIATVTNNTAPVITLFDRLGENWIETASLTAFNTNFASNTNDAWDTQSLRVTLSADGHRVAVGAHRANNASTALVSTNNRIEIFERGNVNWVSSASLNLPVQHQRLRSFSASIALDQLTALTTMNGALYLHEYQLSNNQWRESLVQRLDNINAGRDSVIVSSASGNGIAIAGWEAEGNTRRAPVAWKLERRSVAWISSDSVRLAPITDASAELRLAADTALDSMAIGWQATSKANLDFHALHDQRWVKLFSLPRALSLAFSSDSSTALVGASGGFFAFSAAD